MRLFLRYRHPDRNPDDETQRFETLWHLLYEGDPESVRYSDKQPQGDPASHKRVVLSSRDFDGDRMPVTLEWVRFRGSWYIDARHYRDQEDTAAAE